MLHAKWRKGDFDLEKCLKMQKKQAPAWSTCFNFVGLSQN